MGLDSGFEFSGFKSEWAQATSINHIAIFVDQVKPGGPGGIGLIDWIIDFIHVGSYPVLKGLFTFSCGCPALLNGLRVKQFQRDF